MLRLLQRQIHFPKLSLGEPAGAWQAPANAVDGICFTFGKSPVEVLGLLLEIFEIRPSGQGDRHGTLIPLRLASAPSGWKKV